LARRLAGGPLRLSYSHPRAAKERPQRGGHTEACPWGDMTPEGLGGNKAGVLESIPARSNCRPIAVCLILATAAASFIPKSSDIEIFG
jgi:hypothetical protein